ncbi:hypothetical protein [Shewanella sp. cp20]|uniref:hypothetical protein n=1 Tax=Shewanella sp. cp20 TaxID=1521167 RepID=UPI0005A1AFD6|nr:hypothetical protein [Shewanella sp. cp20]KIO38404.1 hypothetical protein DB48_00035 [Shewanella sp. cp20]
MSIRSKKAGMNKAAEKRITLMETLWTEAELASFHTWDRKVQNGFTTIPRTMTYIGKFINKHSPGKPLSDTYLTLWCHVFDESFIEIKNKNEFATESGFSGERAVTTWTGRMRKLEELGFIKSKDGSSGEFSYLIITNPLKVIHEHYQNHPKDALYNSLAARLIDIGGTFV